MQKHLTFKQKILVAGTLFGMFFGAGNLIFPVHLGQLAGRNVIPAMIGFIITAVGIPIMGVAAIGNTHSDGLQQLSNKVGKGYGYVFSCLLYLTIGPGFAIPRCATTSFTVGVAPMLSAGASESIALLIFSVIFFAIVLILSLRPGEITVWIGKVITPIFLVFLAILVVTALINPSTSVSDVEPAAGYQTGALSLGFIEGYNTMDAIAGLAFGIVVIDIIRSMGVTDDSDVAKDVLSSGLLTSIPMIVIYVTTILMGTQSRGLFETSENGGIALAQISGHYLGRAGSLVLAVTITCACLKTAIGLVTSCSEAFVQMFPKGPKYSVWAIIFCLVSFGIANFGLSTIVAWCVPVLMFIYPLAITLILLALTEKWFGGSKMVYVVTTAFTLAAATLDFLGTLAGMVPQSAALAAVKDFCTGYVPLFNLGMGWIIPACVGFVVGLGIYHMRKERGAKAAG